MIAIGEPERSPMADAGQDLERVGLEALAAAAPVAVASARELPRDGIGVDTGTPAGSPSRITTRPRPCDSPAVRKRSTAPIIGKRGDPRAPIVDGGGGRAAPARPATAPPVGASPASVSDPIVLGTQSVNDWSPNRNVAQFPETDCSRYCLFGPNVSPAATL